MQIFVAFKAVCPGRKVVSIRNRDSRPGRFSVLLQLKYSAVAVEVQQREMSSLYQISCHLICVTANHEGSGIWRGGVRFVNVRAINIFSQFLFLKEQ